MAILVRWDNDAATAILWIFEGRFTWDEFQAAWDETTAMYETVDCCVDMIYDARRLRILPADTISYIRRKFPTRHPNCGMITTVGLDKTMQLLWQTFTTLAAPHLKAYFFETPHEARAFVQQQRASAEAQPGG
jgi:hypothetical protein